MPPKLLQRALLGAVVGFPALFLDMLGFILASSTPPPAPRITIFHHFAILFQNTKQHWYLPFLAQLLSHFPCYFLNALKAKPHWYIAFAAVFFALLFKTLLHASRAAPKSSPRGCRGISCSVFGHGWTHGCAVDPPASPEDN